MVMSTKLGQSVSVLRLVQPDELQIRIECNGGRVAAAILTPAEANQLAAALTQYASDIVREGEAGQ